MGPVDPESEVRVSETVWWFADAIGGRCGL